MGLDLTKIMELWALCDKTDGGSRPAVSDGTAVDFVTGETIPADTPVTEYYDADGNVYATCIKPVTDTIKTAGEEIPAGTIITDPPADFDQSLLDTNGALIAAYTATSTWIFDGDEACPKSGPDCCKNPQVEIAPAIDPTDEAAVLAWVVANDYDANADQVFYYIGDGTVQTPDYVWIGEGDGTIVQTECPLPKEMCTGGPLKDKEIATLEVLTTAGFALQRHTFGPSADDPCVPVDPPCPTIPQYVRNNSDQQYYWPPGGPWEPVPEEPRSFVVNNIQNGPALDDAAIAAIAATGAPQVIFEYRVPVTNPSPCREAAVKAVIRQGNISMNAAIAANGEGNNWNMAVANVGSGFLTPVVGIDTSGMLPDLDDGQSDGDDSIFGIRFPPGVGLHADKLDPLETKVYGVDVRFNVQNEAGAPRYHSNSLNLAQIGGIDLCALGALC